MRVDGWIFMLTSWAVILGLFGYSMYLTLTSKPPPDDSQSPQDEQNGGD